MDKKTISYLFIGIFSAILLLGVVFGIKVFNDSKQISQGDSLMAMEKYKEASLVYEGILRKGYREDVSKKMDRAQELMESKKNYEQGLKLWDDEKYKDAIKFLSKVSKNDKERYLTTVQKINEIEESLLSEIQEVIDQGDLDSGMDMLNDYLKIMPKSETAKNMKQDINFQRSQEKAEYERQVEEEKNQEMEEEKNMKVWSQATYAVGTTQTIVSKEANLRVPLA